jgi:LPXTG-motif cell wall-anchored protein
MKTIGLTMLLVGAAGLAVAGVPTATPEIDAATGVGALVLLSGALLVIRSRRKK